MRTDRKILALLAALTCLLAAASAAVAATAGLDSAYGEGGVATVELSGAEYLRPQAMASARDGAAYVLAGSRTCGRTTCTEASFLYRYLADGGRDESFGSGGALALPPNEDGYGVSVDEQGRPLVFATEANAVVIRRYTTSGQLDTGFGAGGSATVPCACSGAGVTVTPARRERILVEVGGPAADSSRQRPTAQVALTRLRPDGAVDPTFGQGGTVPLSLTGVSRPGRLAVTGRGAVLMAGTGCCTAATSYALRVSARGRLDTRFGATAKRSLRRLARFGEFPEMRAVLPRGDGTIDIVGTSQFEHGFDLRLRPNGELAAGFGRQGAVKLPMPIASAALGSHGAIVAANEQGSGKVFRIFRNGRLDPAFGGPDGIEVPRPQGADDVVVGTQAGGRALLMDLGNHFCRYGGCPPTPRLTAFLEGSARR
jgi:uncharacterized delta-60 repeat protein